MRTVAELQAELDQIAARCDLHRHHHRLVALSPTEAAVSPLPEVRALPPPEERVACVKEELKRMPDVTLRNYPD